MSELTSRKLPDHELWQWSPEALDQALRQFVLCLPEPKQPSAFRAFVEACCLDRNSSQGGRKLQNDEERGKHGRLLLAAVLYYSFTSKAPPMPEYLSSAETKARQRRLAQTDAGPAHSVYEVYNINDEYNSEYIPEYASLKLQSVFADYGLDDSFDQGSLDRFQGLVYNACGRRRLFNMSDDETIIGIGPGATRAGDIVVQPLGACAPFVLRPVDNHFLCVGECFISKEMPGTSNAIRREESMGTTTYAIR